MPATNDSSLAPAADTETAPALDVKKASRSVRRGLISLAILVALAGGLMLAVPGLNGVAHTLAHMRLGWIAFGAVVSLGGAGSVAVGAWLLIDRAVPAAVGIAVIGLHLARNGDLRLMHLSACDRAA